MCGCLKLLSPLLAQVESQLKPPSPLRSGEVGRLKPASPLRVRNGCFECVFRLQRCCQVPGFVEACLGRFLSCCCVFVFCLLRCDSAQGEVRAACVVPVDPG